MSEPVLTDDDLDAWEMWRRTALLHSRSKRHTKKLDSARRMIDESRDACESWAIMWSGGKDSTAMLHLLRQQGVQVPVFSEKDDLDFPGERDYVERLARAWGADLHIITPRVSLQEWVREHASDLAADEDFHGRAAGLSKEHFYALVEEATVSFGGIYLGLRQEESHGRRMNRAVRGRLYQKASGQWACTPIADWTGLDVMAYMAAHEIEPLHVYRCIAFMHRDEPWRVRKSWWIPGASTRWGGIAWLRHYYPSLFSRLCEILPDARRHA